jgi:hypothetical protein
LKGLVQGFDTDVLSNIYIYIYIYIILIYYGHNTKV